MKSKMPWYLAKDICMDSHPQDFCGNDNLNRFLIDKWLRQSAKLGMFVHAPRKGLVSLRLCGRQEKRESDEGLAETHVGHVHETW